MTCITYILERKNPVPCDDLEHWAYWMDDINNKRVAITEIDKLSVSTVFLGINHSLDDENPVLFETMVFDNRDRIVDKYHRRYRTWDDAEAGHWAIMSLVKLEVKRSKIMNLDNQFTDEEIQIQMIEQKQKEEEQESLAYEHERFREQISELSDKPVVLNREWFEHLLNCLANQKHINELSPDEKIINQKIIDDTWRDGMAILREEENYTSWGSPISPR